MDEKSPATWWGGAGGTQAINALFCWASIGRVPSDASVITRKWARAVLRRDIVCVVVVVIAVVNNAHVSVVDSDVCLALVNDRVIGGFSKTRERRWQAANRPACQPAGRLGVAERGNHAQRNHCCQYPSPSASRAALRLNACPVATRRRCFLEVKHD